SRARSDHRPGRKWAARSCRRRPRHTAPRAAALARRLPRRSRRGHRNLGLLPLDGREGKERHHRQPPHAPRALVRSQHRRPRPGAEPLARPGRACRRTALGTARRRAAVDPDAQRRREPRDDAGDQRVRRGRRDGRPDDPRRRGVRPCVRRPGRANRGEERADPPGAGRQRLLPLGRPALVPQRGPRRGSFLRRHDPTQPLAMASAQPVDYSKPRIGAAVRGEFPIFESATYLNSCSQGALSYRVRGAVEGWLAGWDENGAEWDFWVERNEAFRSSMAGLLHARADDVAVTTSVSQGVSALVSALDLRGERNRIVISEYEFPTIGQIAHAQELRGAEVVHVRPDADGSIRAERFAEAIDERKALVCCTALSYRSGHRHDVAAIAEAAHQAGALVLADSYQACGAVELDVRSLGADVVTGGTVKYLLGT